MFFLLFLLLNVTFFASTMNGVCPHYLAQHQTTCRHTTYIQSKPCHSVSSSLSYPTILPKHTTPFRSFGVPISFPIIVASHCIDIKQTLFGVGSTVAVSNLVVVASSSDVFGIDSVFFCCSIRVNSNRNLPLNAPFDVH